MDDKIISQLKFLHEVDRMKNIDRRTFIADGSRRENDAEHSWHFALMALVMREYAPEGVNIDRVIRMALVHDLVEIYAGDTYAFDEKANIGKEEREKSSADRLFALLPGEQGSELRALWEEFDALETDDSKFANCIDRLQPLINNYINRGSTWEEGRVSEEQIRRRMAPLAYVPEFADICENIITESKEKGYLRKWD